MARITPVKLASSSKALWFDSNGIEAAKGDNVVVLTARGNEFGTVAETPFEATQEQIDSLKSALKPVRRLATEEDAERARELEQMGRDAMPAFRELVEADGLEMRPISVEYLFDGDKAVFYFEADDRVDFRDLVRKLASHFHVRVDMRQIGVRDEARMVGGLGHCGQELCCKRLGGEFCPVSIRMAKEQDLSLNPQKISGICGRLMCCLRYEYDAYKDFKSRAPKVGAMITTPDGTGKVVSLDVPQEIVTIQGADDKKIKIPLADMSKSDEKAARPDMVGQEAWDRANDADELSVFGNSTFITSQFTAQDKLGDAKAVHREPSNRPAKQTKTQKADKEPSRSSRKEKAAPEPKVETRKPRRRSTKLTAGADSETMEAVTVRETREVTEPATKQERPSRRQRARARAAEQQVEQKAEKQENAAGSRGQQRAEGAEGSSSERRRRRRTRSGNQAPDQKIAPVNTGEDKPTLRPGHRSSSLRQRAAEGTEAKEPRQNRGSENSADNTVPNQAGEGRSSRRRPRRRRRSSGDGAASEKSE